MQISFGKIFIVHQSHFSGASSGNSQPRQKEVVLAVVACGKNLRVKISKIKGG
jgi:hypothetical protein